jgi:hypothetical protein
MFTLRTKVLSRAFELLGIAVLLAGLHGVALADGGDPPQAAPPRGETAPPGVGQWRAVGASELAKTCGGFQIDDGLSILVGVERTVSVNGQVTSTLSFGFDSAQGRVGSVLTTGATVIQNSLSDQDIRTATVVNAQVNASSVLRSVAEQSAIRQAIVSAIHR